MNLKQKLSKKLKKAGGFTLIEMLIVVAIIAILVAVSIPMVGTSLEKARVSTDAANERAAKGAALVEYVTKGETTQKVYYYDAANGKVAEAETGISAYGQCKNHKGGYIRITIKADGTASIAWVGAASVAKPDGIEATTAS